MDTFIDRFSHRRSSQEMIQANAAAEAAKMQQLQRQVDEYDTLLQDMRKVNLKAADNLNQMQKVLKESFEKLESMQKDNGDTQSEEAALVSEIKKQIEELLKQGNDTQSEREALLSEMKNQHDELIPQIRAQLEEFVPQIKGQVEELVPQIKDQVEELMPQIKGQVEELVPQIKSQMDEAFQRSDDFLHRENVKVYRNVQAALTEELDKRTNTLTQKQEEGIKKQKALLPISIVIMLMVIIDIVINLLGIVIKF